MILYLKKAQGTIKLSAVKLRKTVLLNIFKGGLPSLIRQGLASVSNGVLNNLTKPFGDSAFAAISIVNRYTSFVLAVGIGLGQGLQPVASFNYSAGKIKRVKKGMLFTWIFSTALVGMFSLGGFVFAPQIISVFQKTPSVVEIGTVALRFASIGLLFLPSSTTANMLFQSIRKSNVASFLALLRSGLIFIPVLVVLTLIFGLWGIQSAQGLADVLSGLISIPFMIAFLKKEQPDKVAVN